MRKTININGIEISYLEKNERAKKVIFFIHGNSGSSRTWNNQINSNLLEDYRLIAIDLPGHGKSFPSLDPEKDYSPLGTGKILYEFVAHLASNCSYVLVGFSYGTNLIAEIVEQNIKPVGIILVSSCVTGKNYELEKVFVQHSSPSIFFYNEPDNKTVISFFEQFILGAKKEDLLDFTDDYLTVASDFKPTLFKTAGDGKISDEINALQKLNIPVCIVFGQNDNLVNVDYLDNAPFPIWNSRIHKIPNSGHWVHIDNAAIFNQLIAEYIEEQLGQPTHA